MFQKLRLPFTYTHRPQLDRRDFYRSGCDVVFTHDDFPNSADSIPVVWMNSILDPEMVLANGWSKEHLQTEFELKKQDFHKAAAVQVSTEAERVRLGQWFPEIANKFVGIPLFSPDLKAIADEDMSKKIERIGPLRCLFVGHEARRKGLDRVYSAMVQLPLIVQKHIHLTVISKQTDGSMVPPQLPNLQVYSTLPHDRIIQLMRESDVFLMPSYFESYGLVYLEAMAQGAIPVVPNWEVQREIVDDGKAGIIASGDAAELAHILVRLCDDVEFRHELAFSARQRFKQRFAPSIVASLYASLFRQFTSGLEGFVT